jgi:tRNA modification GTPase
MSTIAAISTPMSVGGIGVIRISGEDAHKIGDKIFKSYSGKKIADIKGYSALFGEVYDGDNRLDEAIALKFVAPKSYTGEDVLEISCHGGLFITERILSLVLKSGAVMAKAGEFTKRAFENGKLDLLEAQAVADMISAEGEMAYNLAFAAKGGALSKAIDKITGKLLSMSASLSAFVDYPDDDIPELSKDNILKTLNSCKAELKKLLSTYEAGQVYKEGINTAIVGRPNVGKSTLMNLFTGYDKSIVTDIAGTTRDVIEETVSLDGIKLRLFDTAGIRTTGDKIEKIGIKRAKDAMEKASLIIAVFDNSEELSDEDKNLISEIKNKKRIGIINKIDKENKLDTDYITNSFDKTIFISAKEGDISEIIDAIKEMYSLGKLNPNEATLATSIQKDGVKRAYNSVCNSISAIESGFPPDAMSADVDIALNALFELTGQKATELVTETVFSEFCVGK